MWGVISLWTQLCYQKTAARTDTTTSCHVRTHVDTTEEEHMLTCREEEDTCLDEHGLTCLFVCFCLWILFRRLNEGEAVLRGR